MAISRDNHRVSARIPNHIYHTLIQAADLMGTTMNQFLVQSAIEKAQKVIENRHVIELTTRSAKTFFNAVENPPPPNKKLRNAMKAYKVSNAEN